MTTPTKPVEQKARELPDVGDIEAWLRKKGELYQRIGQHDYHKRIVEAADEIARLNAIIAALNTDEERIRRDVSTVSEAVERYVHNYDYRCDEGQGYTPTEAERCMIVDAILGFVADVEEPDERG